MEDNQLYATEELDDDFDYEITNEAEDTDDFEDEDENEENADFEDTDNDVLDFDSIDFKGLMGMPDEEEETTDSAEEDADFADNDLEEDEADEFTDIEENTDTDFGEEEEADEEFIGSEVDEEDFEEIEPAKPESPIRRDAKLGADSIEEFMALDRSKYKIEHGYVKFTELTTLRSMNKARQDTKAGLVKSIQEVGILTPIHVMLTPEYDNYLQGDKEEAYKGPKYIVLDGYRRVWNGIKVGLDGCFATIWNFKDKDYGQDFAMILSAILNKTQKHSIPELWDMMQKIKKRVPITARTLDTLFGLGNGDSSKLEEIMTCEYDEIKDQVISGKKSIPQAYNALKKLWDEEDEGARDDKIGVSDYDVEHKVVGKDGTDDDEEDTEPQRVLSNEEVSEILGLNDKYNNNDDKLLEDTAELLKEPPVQVQDVKNRKPLDKDLKAETLRRDNYQCVCCGTGAGLPLKYALSVLQSHHIISVANGGPDTADNIATVCPVCHTLIHTVLWNDGVFSKADFDKLSDKEKERMRKVLKYAHADYQAAKKKGKSSKQIRKDNENHSTFKMPGTDLHQNEDALKSKGIDVTHDIVEDKDTPKEVESDMDTVEQGIE